jgi:hypothetical protein
MKEITFNDIMLCLMIFAAISAYQARKSWRWQDADYGVNILIAALPLLRKVDWKRLGLA